MVALMHHIAPTVLVLHQLASAGHGVLPADGEVLGNSLRHMVHHGTPGARCIDMVEQGEYQLTPDGEVLEATVGAIWCTRATICHQGWQRHSQKPPGLVSLVHQLKGQLAPDGEARHGETK